MGHASFGVAEMDFLQLTKNGHKPSKVNNNDNNNDDDNDDNDDASDQKEGKGERKERRHARPQRRSHCASEKKRSRYLTLSFRCTFSSVREKRTLARHRLENATCFSAVG